MIDYINVSIIYFFISVFCVIDAVSWSKVKYINEVIVGRYASAYVEIIGNTFLPIDKKRTGTIAGTGIYVKGEFMIFPVKSAAQSSASSEAVGKTFEIDRCAVCHSSPVDGRHWDDAFRMTISIYKYSVIPFSPEGESGNIKYMRVYRGQIWITFSFVQRIGVVSYGVQLVDVRCAIIVSVVHSPSID